MASTQQSIVRSIVHLESIRQQRDALARREQEALAHVAKQLEPFGLRVVPANGAVPRPERPMRGGIVCPHKAAGRPCPHPTGVFVHKAHLGRHLNASHANRVKRKAA